MEQTILKPWQEKAISFIAKEKNLSHFYLSGGTALSAYYLHHRVSDDLDFFSFEEPDSIFLHAFARRLAQHLGVQDTRYETLYDRRQFFYCTEKEEWKVEFTHHPFTSLKEAQVQDGIRIDSIRDIAANKLLALTDRFDPKDFVDLYFLLQNTDISGIVTDVEQKFGMKLDPIFLGGELAKVRRVEALPKMLA